MPSRREILSLLGRHSLGLAAVTAIGLPAARAQSMATKGSGIAMHGAPKYKDGFTHFDYVNAAAPRGGSIYHGVNGGTFDNLNPFILSGTAASLSSVLVFDRLMKRADDEPFSMYGLVAKSIETPADRAWVVFELDERAKFHDGSPITPDDIIFSLDILRSKGRPFYGQYFRDVAAVEAVGARGVKFTFKEAGNRELPLIIAGDLPILSKAYWANRRFDQVTLEPPLGSGPYRYKEAAAGRFVAFERVADYWAQDLPVNRGHNNFDLVRVEYFLDPTVGREALKAGEYDFRLENQALAWATQYNTDAVRDGRMIRREIKHSRPAGMQCFVFNKRRPMYRDWRVRRALTLLFDFEWANKNLFYGQYIRANSFFSNSEMAATGLPEGDELKILERFRGRVPDTVFTEPYALPTYAGDGNIREGMRQALALLRAAGWESRDGAMVEAKTGQRLKLDIITGSPQFERIYLPYVGNLKRIGVAAELRVIDPVQYQKRTEKFDFDMITDVFGQSDSPGNEQRNYWSSGAADTEGSDNTIGIKDKAIDELVELIIAATDRENLVASCKALDRVLLHHHFVVPSWYTNVDRYAYWDKFGVSTPHLRGTSWTTWWFDAARAERLKGKIRSMP